MSIFLYTYKVINGFEKGYLVWKAVFVQKGIKGFYLFVYNAISYLLSINSQFKKLTIDN